MVRDALHLSGEVYPIWGADHFLRSTQVSALLYRLFNYLIENEHTHKNMGPPA